MPKFMKGLSFQIILALVVGAVVGKIFGTSLSGFGEIGKIVISWGAGGYACLTEKWLIRFRQPAPFIAVTKISAN